MRQFLAALCLAAFLAAPALGLEYKDRGFGPCSTKQGDEPTAITVPGAAEEEVCEGRCSELAGCYGYALDSGACLLYMQGPLRGDREWHADTNGSRCMEKTPAPFPLPPASEAGSRFESAGPGLCYFNGHAPTLKFEAAVSAEGCEEQCAAGAACWGYSHDPTSGGCALYQQGPLAGGGAAWGEASCVLKLPKTNLRSPAQPLMVKDSLLDVNTMTSYEVADGEGPCSVGGRDPPTTLVPATSEASCQQICTAEPWCYGFASDPKGRCRIYTEGPLEGGCSKKVQVPAPSSDTLYSDAGAGVCEWKTSTEGQVRLLPGLSASECAVRCTLVHSCTGFSSQADTCLLFTGADLRQGGGKAWGFAHCQLKAPEWAPHWSALKQSDDDEIELRP